MIRPWPLLVLRATPKFAAYVAECSQSTEQYAANGGFELGSTSGWDTTDFEVTRTTTVYECPATVTGCPLTERTAHTTTETLVAGTTVYPITSVEPAATMGSGSGSSRSGSTSGSSVSTSVNLSSTSGNDSGFGLEPASPNSGSYNSGPSDSAYSDGANDGAGFFNSESSGNSSSAPGIESGVSPESASANPDSSGSSGSNNSSAPRPPTSSVAASSDSTSTPDSTSPSTAIDSSISSNLNLCTQLYTRWPRISSFSYSQSQSQPSLHLSCYSQFVCSWCFLVSRIPYHLQLCPLHRSCALHNRLAVSGLSIDRWINDDAAFFSCSQLSLSTCRNYEFNLG
ncbi:hypothetical protein BO78DRAFT_451607 [Aspergillus sclerotiicarbonarius CBS 121057]|uniref:Uncharacterized protein n=1 Tax=Aspergillus sclerotiicarbonarius (strain CBS 121057 / IBT 28362) TaxID=1448318 RepID=A0A319ERR7_ASPSB|nr:hypothetical protein BO78DRAFT_451607 [Aspergillus sclerotiicarbonarius CBS 121057]